MVLKKSNSCLNTGLTQRFTNRGAILRRGLPEPETVSFHLEGLGISFHDNRVVFQDALHKISEFLGLRGVDLSLYYDKDGILDVRLMDKTFPYAKHKKYEVVSLSDKVKELIDAEVLETIVKDMHIEINVFRNWTRGTKQTKIFSWSSTERSEECSNTKENRKLHRKMRLNQHSRGLQRKNKIPHRDDQGEAQTDSSNPHKKLRIDIQESHAIDGRLVNKVEDSPKKKTIPVIPGLAHWKHKGFVHGIRSDFKGYNHKTLKLDEIEAALDASDDYENFYYSNNDEYYDSVNLVEELELSDEEVEYNASSEKRIYLADYIMPPRMSKNNSSLSKPNNSVFIPVNRASSEKVVRQPKGSCVFMTETPVSENSDADSGLESNLSDMSSEVPRTEHQSQELTSDPIDDEIVPIDLEANISDFVLKFQQVKLSLPTDLLDRFIKFQEVNESEKLENYLVYDCCMTLAKCYPPSFTLQVDSAYKEFECNWFVIGKAIDVSSDQWQIQMQTLNDHDLDNEIINSFNNVIEKQFSHELTMQNLVDVFVQSIEIQLACCSQVELSTKPERHNSSSQSTESLWCRLKHFVPDQAKTMSIHEALSSVPPPSKEPQPKNSKAETGCPLKTDISMNPMECDICFLPCEFCEPGESQALALIPCGHVFCLSCWTAHVHIGLNGADEIRCMSSDCKQELDETFLRCLAPGHLVKKWHDRVEDNKIERNPLLKWCPNIRCDKVGVIGELTEKVRQFGGLVPCDCQVPWCFACQKEPHWPASCDQIAAFRKLLAKTGNEYEVPSAYVDYTVQMKRCPKCHYPIEKNMGCPSMVCRMCWFNFCWNCLRPVDHSVYTCKPQDHNYVTYRLQNKLVHDLPFKFFPDYLKMNKNRERVSKAHLFPWLQDLCIKKRKPMRIPFYASWKATNNNILKDNVMMIADSCAHLLREIYTILEPLYVLLCFGNMKKKKNSKRVNCFLHEFINLAENLSFIAQRLEEKVISRSMREIMGYSNIAQILLECGQKQLNDLRNSVPKLQTMTRDIDPYPVGETDPKQYLRYK